MPASLCAENTCLHDTHTDTHTATHTHTNSRVCSPSHTHMRARAHARTRTHSCTHTGSGTRVLRERAATTFDRANTRRPRFGAHCCCGQVRHLGFRYCLHTATLQQNATLQHTAALATHCHTLQHPATQVLHTISTVFFACHCTLRMTLYTFHVLLHTILFTVAVCIRTKGFL